MFRCPLIRAIFPSVSNIFKTYVTFPRKNSLCVYPQVVDTWTDNFYRERTVTYVVLIFDWIIYIADNPVIYLSSILLFDTTGGECRALFYMCAHNPYSRFSYFSPRYRFYFIHSAFRELIKRQTITRHRKANHMVILIKICKSHAHQ